MAGIWSSTITIEISGSIDAVARIQSTQDAARYLLDHWVRDRSPAYQAAIRLCTKAIRGETSHEAAYISFMAAVREANFALVSNRRRGATDDLELDIEAVLAESLLAEFKAIWSSGSPVTVPAPDNGQDAPATPGVPSPFRHLGRH